MESNAHPELAQRVLRDSFHVSYCIYGSALISALVLAEVIFIRVYAHLGKKHEALPLCRSAVHKPFLFSLLLLAFHIVEEGSKQLLDRDTMLEFCMILPLLAFRELRRVVGEDNFIRDS